MRVAKHFTSSTDDGLQGTCLCCDNYAAKCTSCSCTENCQAVFDLIHQSISESATSVKTRKVSQVQLKALENKLISYKEQYRKLISTRAKPISCPGIFIEFGDFQVHQIITCCEFLFDLDDILGHIEIWRIVHAKNVLVMLAQVFDDIKCEITEIELSHLGEEEEEMQPDLYVLA